VYQNFISHLYEAQHVSVLSASSNYMANNPPHMQKPEAASAVLSS